MEDGLAEELERQAKRGAVLPSVSFCRSQAVRKFGCHGQLLHPDDLQPEAAEQVQGLALQDHPVSFQHVRYEWLITDH